MTSVESGARTRDGSGILVPVCQTDALRFGTNRAPPVRGGICSERELSQLAAARTGNDFGIIVLICETMCCGLGQTALRLGGSRPLPELFQAAGCRFEFSAKTIQPLKKLLREELEKL
jgi:hypothetical protein